MLATTGGLPLKLGPINDLTNGASNTTQLICSALNAIAPSLTEEGEPLPENIETTIHTISNEGMSPVTCAVHLHVLCSPAVEVYVG